MLKPNQRQRLSRIWRYSVYSLAAILATAFPNSIYAQSDSGFHFTPIPQGHRPADISESSSNPAAGSGFVAKAKIVHVGKTDQQNGDKNAVGQAAFLQNAVPQQRVAQGNRPNQDSIALPPNVPQPPLAPLPQTAPNETVTGPGDVPGLKGEVRIVIDPESGQVTLVGDPEDTAIVRKSFEDISKQTSKPDVERILLKNLSGEQIFESVQEIYDANYAQSQGPAIIKSLRSPNGLYVFGTPQAIESVRSIVTKVDRDAPPLDVEDGPFATFRLKHISAADAKRRLDVYFGQQSTGGGDAGDRIPPDPVTTVADFRSNVLIVRGAKQYLEQAEKVIRSIDVDDGAATDVVRIFPLKNTIAEEIAVVLQDAINGQLPNAGQGFNPDQNAQQQAAQQVQADEFSSSLRSSGLRLKTVAEDGREVSGGIMFDVRVTADRNSNALVVRGPESSMELIGELIQQLDRLPNAETFLKVFAIENGDAQSLLDTLQSLFPSDQNQLQGGNQTNNSSAPLQSASASQGSSLVNLRFSIDERTNSIIATGPAGDLQVVEDLVNRLDQRQPDRRQTVVHRLSNSPVLDVQQALDTWIEARQDRNGDDPRTSPGVNLADRDVDVIPEVVSNSLLISATPEYLPEIMAVIRRLDRRPPMVKVKVLIAEVDLNALEEFGVEVGIQDSLLFDRGTSLMGDVIAGGIGLPFNNPSLIANANATNREALAGQALSNFGTGRVNASGQSGLVLSAGNESVNILLRALQTRNCLRVLSKPHIVTLENLQGRVAVGQQVPRITGTSQSAIGGGVQNSVEDVDVGVILEMTPRVSPDGMIVMFVNATKSALATGSPGVPVAVDAAGNPVFQQPINSTSAQTTIMARSGQTVVFSGLIQETKTHIENGIPVLADLPLLGPLFKFESDSAQRSELMIIMTPYLIDGDEEIEIQNQDEMDRMHWCLCDVAEIYGKTDYNGYRPEEGAVETIYPDQGFEPVNSYEYPGSTESGPSYSSPPVDSRQFEYGTPLGQTETGTHQRSQHLAGGRKSEIQTEPLSKPETKMTAEGGSAKRPWNPFSKKTVYPNRQAGFQSKP
jgi:type II secretory pathway component GspD/PulD (secretin)